MYKKLKANIFLLIVFMDLINEKSNYKIIAHILFDDLIARVKEYPNQPLIYPLKRIKRDTANDYSVQFKLDTVNRNLDDVFNNNTFKVNYASHELFFVKQGKAIVINNYWIQYFKIESPFTQLKFPNGSEFTKLCLSFVSQISEQLKDGNEQMNLCKVRGMRMFNYTVQTVDSFLRYKYQDLIDEHTRNKRFAFPLTALAIGGIIALATPTGGTAGFFAGKNANNVKDQVEALEQQMAVTDKKIELLKDSMLGLAYITSEKIDVIKSQMDMFIKATQSQLKQMALEVQTEIRIINEEFQRHAKFSKIMQFINQLITKFQNLFVIKLNELSY